MDVRSVLECCSEFQSFHLFKFQIIVTKIIALEHRYTSQVAWIGSLEQPIILRFEHLEEDWKMFLAKNKFPHQATLSDRVTYRGKASQEPSRVPALSPDAHQYLKTLYRRDFELYDAVN